MKIEEKKPSFNPFTIEVETPEEALLLKAIVNNCTSHKGAQAAVDAMMTDVDPVKLRDLSSDMYDAINNHV